jgi:hypothetical protein
LYDTFEAQEENAWEYAMEKGIPVHAVKPFKLVYIGMETLFIAITVIALIDALFAHHWGLGWSVFFVGFIASAWGAAAYPVCGGCYGWDRKSH